MMGKSFVYAVARNRHAISTSDGCRLLECIEENSRFINNAFLYSDNISHSS